MTVRAYYAYPVNQDGCRKERRTTDKRKHIGFEIRWIQNLIEAAMRERCEKDGFCITQLQHMIICCLDHNQGKDMYQKDLEEEFHVSRATISNTLQVMERNGLICRSAVKQDARLKKITLTERAIEFSRQTRCNVEELEACMKSGMNASELEELFRLLTKVRMNLEQSCGCRQEEK